MTRKKLGMWLWRACAGVCLSTVTLNAGAYVFAAEDAPVVARSDDDLAADIDFLNELRQDQKLSPDIARLVEESFQAFSSGETTNAGYALAQASYKFVGHSAGDFKLQLRLTALKDRHLISKEEHYDYTVIIGRILQEFARIKAKDTPLSKEPLVGLLSADNFLTASEMLRDGRAYGFAKSLEVLQKKLGDALRIWDASRQNATPLGEEFYSNAKETDRAFAAIHSQYVKTKNEEAVRMRLLQLQSAHLYQAYLPGMDHDALAKIVDPALDAGDALKAFAFPEALSKRHNEGFLLFALQLRAISNAQKQQSPDAMRSATTHRLDQAINKMLAAEGDERTRWSSEANRFAQDLLQNSDGSSANLDVTLFPQATVERLAAEILTYIDMSRVTRQQYLKQAGLWQSLNWSERARSMAALDTLEAALQRIFLRLRSADSLAYVRGMADSKESIKSVVFYTLEAVLDHSAMASEYAGVLQRASMGYTKDASAFFNQADYKTLRLIIADEGAEAVSRIRRNRNLIVALYATLAAETITTVLSGGLTGPAIPATTATLRALTLTTQTAASIARIALVADAGARIYDRTNQQGFLGFASFDTVFDALTILAFLPRMPLPAGTPVTTMQKFGFALQKQVATFQYGSIRQLAVLSVGFAGYQFAYANSISEALAKEGVILSASDIRKRAAGNLAMSLLAFLGNAQYRAQQKATNPTGYAEMQKGLSLRESMLARRLRGAINPYLAGKNFYQAQPSFLRAVGGVGIATAYAAYDYVMINEAILLSYTNPDYNYMSEIEKRHPFPELREGESALTLVGIDPLDAFLYLGAHAKPSHRSEIAKYGDRLYIDDFKSPADLLARIKKQAQAHGPIRYLKIMTHGRPGELFTRDVALTDDAVVGATASGWIDEEWLRNFRDEIQTTAREVFAPDARIVIWACLVGANLEWANEEGEPLHVGDRFMDAFGDAFLVNGGSLDASNRILVGLDAVFGNAIRSAAHEGFAFDAAANKRPLVPLINIEESNEIEPTPLQASKSLAQSAAYLGQGHLYAFGDNREEEEKMAIPTVDSSLYMFNRVQRMVFRMHEVWYKYGLQLEGPWWHERYSHREVPAH